MYTLHLRGFVKKKNYFIFQGEKESLFLLICWNWDSCIHSIVCHHVVCCGQMNQESRDTLLLIWQCSLTAQTQHMVLTTSWHSGPAVDYRPANICLQLFNNFHGHLKSSEHLNRWREGPLLGISCVVDYQRISLFFWASCAGIGWSENSDQGSTCYSNLTHSKLLKQIFKWKGSCD